MRTYCIVCNYKGFMGPHEVTREHVVRGERFKITYPFYRCPECGCEEVADSVDPAELLFGAYLKKHGFLEPEEITKIREAWGLSELAFANRLGIEASTLNCYEGGGLQTLEEDARIRLYEPLWYIGLVNEHGLEFTYYKGVRPVWTDSETPVQFDITGPGKITGVFFSMPQGNPYQREILRFRWKTNGVIEHITKMPCDKGDILEVYLTREAVRGLELTVHWKFPPRGELIASPGPNIPVTRETY